MSDRGIMINTLARLGMRLTEARRELPEVEKQARKTPRKDMADERAKVEAAKVRVEPLRAEIVKLAHDYATLHGELIAMGAYPASAPSFETMPSVGHSRCGRARTCLGCDDCKLDPETEASLDRAIDEYVRDVSAGNSSSNPPDANPFNCCGGNDEHPPFHCSDCDEHPWVLKNDPRCVSDPANCPHTKEGRLTGIRSGEVTPGTGRPVFCSHDPIHLTLGECQIARRGIPPCPECGTIDPKHERTSTGLFRCFDVYACEQRIVDREQRSNEAPPSVPPGWLERVGEDVAEARVDVLDDVCTWLAASGHKAAADHLYATRNRFICADREGTNVTPVIAVEPTLEALLADARSGCAKLIAEKVRLLAALGLLTEEHGEEHWSEEAVLAEVRKLRARCSDKVIPAPRHDPYIGPLTQDEKDDLSSWRVDFGFRHGLSEAAEIDLQEKFDELCTPMPGATDDPRRGNALDYANAEMHPGVVAVLDAAERLAEEVWSDSRLDEELEVLCHAVQAMRDAETMVTDEQGAEAAARLGIDVPKWAAEIRAKVHYPRFACVKCGDPWTPNPEVCGGAAYHVWQPFVGERNRPDSAKSGES
jgi:hypothetical protein